jgi:hypothetical protein
MASSLIRGARYWPDTQALELCFSGGRRYLYVGVPQEIAERFRNAPSKGRFFNTEIKGQFDCHPLRDEPSQGRTRRAAND